MIINQITEKVLIVFCISVSNTEILQARGDCGLPAIPESTKLSEYKQRYEELTEIAYECGDRESELIEGKYRKCVNHRWTGSLPRCAKEVKGWKLERIEIKELGRYTRLYREIDLKSENQSDVLWVYRRNARIVNNNVKYFECPKTKYLWNINQSQSWTFKGMRNFYFNYFVLYMRGGLLWEYQNEGKLQLSATIEDVVSSTVCRADRFDRLNDSVTYKMGFICDKVLQMSPVYEGIDELLQNIKVKVETKDVINVTTSFCDLRLYLLSDSCGSPENPLHSILLAKEKAYAVFACKEGFELVGNERVRCSSPEGTWVNEFPICRPAKTCKIPALDREDPHIDVQYRHYYVVNGTKFAEPDDEAIYSCVNASADTRIHGPIARICKDGKWSGSQPVCALLSDVDMMRVTHHLDPKEQSKIYNPTKLFVIIMAMFGSFFVGGVCVAILLFIIIRRRRKRPKRPHISVVIDDVDDVDYDRRHQEVYSSIRVSQSSNFSNEILNPLYENYHKYGNPLNIPLEESLK